MNSQNQSCEEVMAILMTLSERVTHLEAKIDELIRLREQSRINEDRIGELERAVVRHDERWKMIAFLAGTAGALVQAAIQLLTNFVK